jgi:hypothetical protein
MADSFTSSINLRKPEVGAAFDSWGGSLNGDLDLLDAVFLATGLSTVAAAVGQPFAGVPGVGLRIGIGKVLNIEGQAQFKDPTTITKVGTFSMDQIPAATTVDLKFPAAGGTIATTTVLAATVQAAHPTGTVLQGYYGNTPPSGYIFLDGRTIGDASSAATNRANADCSRLFQHLWTNTANTQCPVLPSRGASAAADWAAHKRITLPDHSGRTMAGRDNLSGTSRNVLSPGIASSTTRAAVGGTATHALSVGELAAHSHSGANGYSFAMANAGTAYVSVNGGGSTFIGYSSNTGNTGSGEAHQNTQPTIVIDVIIAL